MTVSGWQTSTSEKYAQEVMGCPVELGDLCYWCLKRVERSRGVMRVRAMSWSLDWSESPPHH